MDLRKIKLLLLAIVLLTGISLAYCGAFETGKVADDAADNKLNIVVSILPQADLVKMVGEKMLKLQL